MIVTQENQRLYLSNWKYNACRIMTALSAVVENNGGTVKPQRHKAVISNRTLSGAVRDLEEKLFQFEALQADNYNERRAEYIAKKRAELEKIQRIPNEQITVTHTTWINFTLDNVYYSYSVDDNPFFPFHWCKTPVKNGKYSLDAVHDECKKEWLYDCFFSFRASDEDVKEAANLIFNMLVNAKCCPIRRDAKKQRVPNTYDGGYHYETILAPERFGKIDWIQEEK